MEEDRAEANLGTDVPEPTVRKPKRRFIGRRAAVADGNQPSSDGGIEDSKAVQGEDVSQVA